MISYVGGNTFDAAKIELLEVSGILSNIAKKLITTRMNRSVLEDDGK